VDFCLIKKAATTTTLGGLPVDFLVAAGYWPATGYFGN
jgi:hypothetical protein